MRRVILIGLFSVLAGSAFAQAHPDAAEILKKVGETYRAAREYELISTSTGTALPGRLLLAFRAPNRYRIEGNDPSLDNADGTFDQVVLVYDGSSVWLYHPKASDYASFTGNNLAGDLKPEAVEDLAIGRFRSAADLSGTATFLREDVLEIAGTKLDCYVVSAPISVPGDGTSVHTWWVEKNSNHIVREDHDGSSVAFTTVKLNERLPDDLFKFTPPPGARKIGGN